MKGQRTCATNTERKRRSLSKAEDGRLYSSSVQTQKFRWMNTQREMAFAQGKIVDGSRNAWRPLWRADLSPLVNAR